MFKKLLLTSAAVGFLLFRAQATQAANYYNDKNYVDPNLPTNSSVKFCLNDLWEPKPGQTPEQVHGYIMEHHASKYFNGLITKYDFDDYSMVSLDDTSAMYDCNVINLSIVTGHEYVDYQNNNLSNFLKNFKGILVAGAGNKGIQTNQESPASRLKAVTSQYNDKLLVVGQVDVVNGQYVHKYDVGPEIDFVVPNYGEYVKGTPYRGTSNATIVTTSVLANLVQAGVPVSSLKSMIGYEGSYVHDNITYKVFSLDKTYENARAYLGYTVETPTLTLIEQPNYGQTSTVTVQVGGGNTPIVATKYAPGDVPASYFAMNGETVSSNTFTVATNGTYTVYLKDAVGSEVVQTITTTKVDTTKPTITVTQTKNGNNVVISINASDNQSGIAEIVTPNGSVPTTTTEFTVTTNGTHTFTVKDKAGNETTQTVTVSSIVTDTQAPTITLTEQSTYSNVDVTVTANISDNDGVTVQKYASGNQPASYFASKGTVFNGSTFKVTANGVYTVYAKDKNGNESVKTIQVTKVDKIAPKIQGAFTQTGNTVTISVNASDNESGLLEMTSPNSTVQTNTTQMTVTANGTYVFTAKDKAGNSANYTMTITSIDMTGPSIILAEQNTFSNQEVSVIATIQGADGIAIKKWAVGNQPKSYFATNGMAFTTGTFKVNANGVYTVYAKDKKGNETVQTFTVTKMDTTIPTVNVVQSKGVITLRAQDSQSGVKSITLPNQQTVTVANVETIVEKNGSYTFVIEDHAGNKKVETVIVTDIGPVPKAEIMKEIEVKMKNLDIMDGNFVQSFDSLLEQFEQMKADDSSDYISLKHNVQIYLTLVNKAKDFSKHVNQNYEKFNKIAKSNNALKEWKITTNIDIEESTQNKQAITVVDSFGHQVSVIVSIKGKEIVLKPTQPWVRGHEYNILIEKELTSKQGKKIKNPTSIPFKVQ